MADVLISIGGKVAELLVEPVGCQFCYVIRPKKFIESLRSQVENLEALRNGTQGSIDCARRNMEEIRDDVNLWIGRVDEFIEEAKKFLDDCGTKVNRKCFNGCFPDLVTRYRLAKEAKQKSVEAEDQLGEGGKLISNISYPAPPLGIESVPSRSHETYKATQLAMMNVMEALSDDNINFIGIHGVGGVGKTTLVKEIGKKAKADKLFDEVVMAVVSQNPEIGKIRDQIADMLGLQFIVLRSETGRASQLCARLKEVKKILVILDDVWKGLDLTAVGIPFGDDDHKGCKILITTRREQVCNSMGMEMERTKIVRLEVLSKQDSWDLFSKNAGAVVDSPGLNDVAKKVCNECGGLPIALVTVGSAMKGKYDPEEWEEAARELKKSVPSNIEGVDDTVYGCLKLSYDYLKDEEARACFLLCSLFLEDYDIKIKELVQYGMGLRVFKNVDTMREVRGRANSVINSLKASCLLLASDKQGCIRMHDVVRDVAISIGSNKYFVRAGCGLKNWPNVDGLDQFTGISLMGNQISNLPDVWECPNLQILLLQNNKIAGSCSAKFFSGMKAIKVLDFSWNSGIEVGDIPIPSYNLTCLHTLILDSIAIKDTTFLGQIKTLEVLSLKGASLFAVPFAIRELTNLRSLDMTDIKSPIIPTNVLSPLSHLEDLYLDGLGTHPCVEVAALRSLPSLNMLTMSIADVEQIPDDFIFPELERFILYVGRIGYMEDLTRGNYLGLGDLVGPMIRWRKCLRMVLKRASRVGLHQLQDIKNIFPNLSADVECLNVLKVLTIEGCSHLEYLIDDATEEPQATRGQPGHLPVLSNLEELTLHNLENFKGMIYQGALLTPSGRRHVVQLCNLRSMEVTFCRKLKFVFQPCIAQALQKLEYLRVDECEEVEEIVGGDQNREKEEKVMMVPFKSLKTIILGYLPKLSSFCSTTRNFSFEWPSLEELEVTGCPNMKTFAATATTTSGIQSTAKLNSFQMEYDIELPLEEGREMEHLNQYLLNKFNAKDVVESLSEEEIEGLKATFTNMDTDENGTVTYEELKTGLSRLRLKLSEVEVNLLMKDAQAHILTGRFHYLNFVTRIVVQKVLRLYEAFQHLGHSGTASYDEFESVMKEHGMGYGALTKDIMPNVKRDEDARINYLEFLRKMRRALQEQYTCRQH